MADAILAQGGIYAIRNTVNNKVYIGSSANIPVRWRSHKNMLGRGIHPNIRLQRAWLKYDGARFDFSVVEHVKDVCDLIQREQHWIDSLSSWAHDVGYNICRIAGSTVGTTRTPESRAKIAAKARFRSPTAETRAKLSAALKGRKVPPERVARSSASRTGRKLSPSHIENMRAAQTGKKLSAETKAKIAEAVKRQWADGKRFPAFIAGRKMAPEVVEKVAAAHRGMKRSLETRAKISAAAKNRSAEYLAKMAASLTGRKLSPETIAKRQATRVANGSHIPSAETRKKRSESLKGRKKTPEHIANAVAARLANKLTRIAQQQ